MIKKIFAVISCLLLLVVFLVIFGGFAFIDFAIKLMWIAFSFLITFVCNNLNITFIVDRLNKFLAKYGLTVAETPRVRGDSITFYNMEWKNEAGNKIQLPQVEVRVDAVRVVLDYFKEDREKRLFEDIKEITIRQPQVELHLEPTTDLSLPMPALKTEAAKEKEAESLFEILLALRMRLNVENGTVRLKTGEEIIELDSVGGQLINDPEPLKKSEKHLFNLHLACLYEGENISLHNHEAEDRYVLNGSKLVLPKIWNIAKLWLPIIPREMELQEGKLTDLRIAFATDRWKSLRLSELDFRLEECALSYDSVRVENLEGSFHTEDVRSIYCRKLIFDINEQGFRLKGQLALGEQKGYYSYDIKVGANSYSWKNDLELNVLPGFGVNGQIARAGKELKLSVKMNETGTLCIHTPGRNTASVCRLEGELLLAAGKLSFENIGCRVNEKPILFSEGWYDLASDEYGFKAKGSELDIALLSDAPVSGHVSGAVAVEGNLKSKKLAAQGNYEIGKVVYEKWKHFNNLGEGTLKGSLSWQGEELQLVDNKLFFGERAFTVPSCSFERGKLKIEFPSLESYVKDKVGELKDSAKKILKFF